MKCVRIVVSGRVQGVFYRKSTREKALSLGLRGWVKNQEDGSVYIEAEGDDKVLNELIVWCKQGPVQAHVSKVHYEEIPFKGFVDFSIKR
jgi:acylphosphatase